MKAIKIIISIVVCVLLFLFFNNLFLAPLNFGFAGIGWLLFFIGIIGTFIAWNHEYTVGYDSVKENAPGYVFLVLTKREPSVIQLPR